MSTNRFLITGNTIKKFSIQTRPGQTRKEICSEVDQIVGHLNYSVLNYDIPMGSAFPPFPFQFVDDYKRTINKLAEKFSISKTLVANIVRGESWI